MSNIHAISLYGVPAAVFALSSICRVARYRVEHIYEGPAINHMLSFSSHACRHLMAVSGGGQLC